MKPEDIPDDIWETAQAVARTIPDLDAEIKIARALLAERLKERELCAVTGGDAIIQKHPILAQMVRNAIRSRP